LSLLSARAEVRLSAWFVMCRVVRIDCSFSNLVSLRDLLTCDDATCLTRCHRVFVSNSCHFVGRPLPIPLATYAIGEGRRQPVRKVPSRDGYPRGSSRVVERWREMRARQHSASGITDRVSIIHDRVCSFGYQVAPQYISVWRRHRSFVKGIGELRL